MHRIIFIILFISFAGLSAAQDKHVLYIQKYKDISYRLMHQYGIPASVILGIAIVESGSGTSILAKRFYNHFGIVGKNRNAIKKLGHPTRYKEYPSDTASYIHFCEVIKRKPLYDTLQGKIEYQPWLKAIRKSGYAASSAWEKNILMIIRRYKLDALDNYMGDPLNEPASGASSPQ